MTMQPTKLASLKEEVLEEGAAKRPIYTPRGAPLRAYQEWLNSTDAKPTGKDNFCHYSRVVAKVYLGRLKAFVQTHKTIKGVLLGMLISTLAVLIAMMGLTSTVISTVAWTYVWAGAFLAVDSHSKRKSAEIGERVVSKPYAFIKRHAWFFAPPFALFYVLLWPFYTKMAKRFFGAVGERTDMILAWAFIVFAGMVLISLGSVIYYGFGGSWIAIGAYVGALCAVTALIVYAEKTKPVREAKAKVAQAAAEAKAVEGKRLLAMVIYDAALREWYDADDNLRKREPDYREFLAKVAAAHVASNGSYVYEGFFFSHTLMIRFDMPSKYYLAVNGVALESGRKAKERLVATPSSSMRSTRRFVDTRIGKVLVGIGDFASLGWAYIRVFKWRFACPFIEIPVAASDEDSKVVA